MLPPDRHEIAHETKLLAGRVVYTDTGRANRGLEFCRFSSGVSLMLRKLTALLALVFVVACVSAKEYKGSITKLDTEKKTMTVKVGDEEKTFAYTDTTEFVAGKKGALDHEKLKGFAEKLSEKARPATVETTEKDGKEEMKDGHAVVSKVTLTRGKKGQ
jgi:hypothetical protein